MKSSNNIAIIGGGPAASTLAILLSRQGRKVVIYYTPEQAPILVGESLVPMIIPMLQDLGIEQQVAAYSMYKPGACFTFNASESFEFRFADFAGGLPTYAYNVPRKDFNQTLRRAAEQAGAKLIERKVKLLRNNGSDSIELDVDSIQAAADYWRTEAADLIIDASGRARLLGRFFDIPAEHGPRQDIALFAHVDRTELVKPGYVHNDRLEQGWCWRIPLPDRVSLGFVVPAAYTEQSGDNAEQQYDHLLRSDTVLQKLAPDAQRLTPVLRYDNYQSLSSRLYGDNWVMLGDSGGFVDPVFSSGMLIAMESAYKLAHTLAKGKPLAHYEKAVREQLQAWFEIVGYYYNGRLMTSIKVGETLANTRSGRLAVPWISRHMSRIFSGAVATSPFSLNLLRILVKYGLRDRDPEYYKIG